MNTDPLLVAVLEDVSHIRSWCAANPGAKVPDKAVAYLAENAEALAFFISVVYDLADKRQRAALDAAHRTLDYSVIETANRGLAEATLKEAIQQHSGNPLAEVSDDDVVVLLRVLEYAQYIDSKACPMTLAGSPLGLP